MKKISPKYVCLFFADVAFIFVLMFINFTYDEKWVAPLATGADMFNFFAVPLYLLLRSVLSRVFLKNPWWPNLMLFAVISVGLPLLHGDFFKGNWEFVVGAQDLGLIAAAICIVNSLVTGGVMRLVSYIKNKDRPVV